MQVLIVGGGIAGLSTAIALKQKGIEAEIIEKASSWRSGGAGLHLPGNAVVPMERLGIRTDVESQSFAFPEIRYCDQKDSKLFSLDLSDGSWPAFQAISRDTFHKILVEKAGNVPVRFGIEIKTLSQEEGSPDSLSKVEFSDGKTVEYDLVIAADGINSATRGMLFGSELQPQSAGITCWRWITEIEGLSEPHFMLGRGKILLLMPISSGRAYVFASITDPNGKYASLNNEAVNNDVIRREFAEFGGAVPHILKRLEQDGPVLPGQLQQMLVPEWVKGACVLVGDAAHGTLPTMAQGASMAMEDALVLAEELDAKSSIEKALAAYQTRRIERAQWVQHQSLKRMGLARLKARTLIFLRNKLMKAAGAKILASGWRPLIDQDF
ncbi:FAD-dependent monooxygenase [Kiloniella sp.]|uniref:FAD-dependent monooxygenase n=1 Tax=Kiloniella sp. TaxID=1938587 RepID=UPI003B028995